MSESSQICWGAKAFCSSMLANLSTELVWGCTYCIHTPSLPPSPRQGVGISKSPTGHSNLQKTLRTTVQGEQKSKQIRATVLNLWCVSPPNKAIKQYGGPSCCSRTGPRPLYVPHIPPDKPHI